MFAEIDPHKSGKWIIYHKSRLDVQWEKDWFVATDVWRLWRQEIYLRGQKSLKESLISSDLLHLFNSFIGDFWMQPALFGKTQKCESQDKPPQI